MDAAAVAGRVALQCCEACGAGQYPPRELCRVCLSDALGWSVAEAVPGVLMAVTLLQHSHEQSVRPRLPLQTGLVRLGEGMVAVCFVAGGLEPPAAVRVRAAADAQGRAILTAES